MTCPFSDFSGKLAVGRLATRWPSCRSGPVPASIAVCNVPISNETETPASLLGLVRINHDA